MIKIIEDLKNDKTKDIDTNINTVICRLKTIQENLQFNPEKYDLDTLFDILSQIYDEMGDFNIVVQDKTVK